jgi:sugar lactone lactonase YvrE
MLKKTLITLLLATILLLGSLPLAAQTETPEALPDNVPALLVKANSAYAAKDYLTYRKVLERLVKMRPNNSEYMYQLVIAHALLDEKRQAYDLMLRMQQQGLAYDFNDTEDSMNIRDTEVFDYVNDLMKRAAEPMGESEPVFSLPGSVVLPAAIAWDESRQKFLVGTIAKGSILAVDKDGQISELLKATKENGMWAVFDILVDQSRNRLWVSSAATPGFSGFDPADKGRSALFEFDLETLQMVRRYPVPVDGRQHVLGSMTLGPDGDIYIADRALPIIYSKPAGEQKLKALLATREMISMRGIAIQPDGRVMYVADREMGIMVIDIKGQKAGKLAVPDTFNIGGIDGLYLWDNHLIVIQNGIKPQRVMRLQLDSSGTQVTAVRPLAVAQPAFDYPSFGTVQPDMQQFMEQQAKKVENRTKKAEKN